jgi:hypothetical protein
MSKTSLALGNLRGFTILMVVAFHSCIAYLGSQPLSALPFNEPPYGWLANPIIDSERWFGLDLFCAFQYVYLYAPDVLVVGFVCLAESRAQRRENVSV